MEGGSGERLRREEGREVVEEKGRREEICGGKKVMVFVFIYVASYYILM